MNSLPPELQQTVAECLCPTDLRALRLVNKSFSTIAARPLFEVLNFSGNAQHNRIEVLPGEAMQTRKHIGRKRTVKYAKLSKAVEEVLPLARYAKTFKFSPAYYREGFWQDYRRWLVDELDRPVSEVDFDPDVEDYDEAEERYLQERQSRPEREAPLIKAVEPSWSRKVAEQNANASSIADSLVTLFKNMPILHSIEIDQWYFHKYGQMEVDSSQVDIEYKSSSQTIHFLETLGQALLSADRRIGDLNLPRIDTDKLRDTVALRHVFRGLKRLKLQLWDVDFLLEDRPEFSALVELFKCSRTTLQSLEILGGIHSHLPERGVHTILNMLGTGDAGKPLVYPELHTVRLRTLILSTPPLIDFLNSQPKISHLGFAYIYLGTPHRGWPFLIGAFPRTVQSWTISGELGHEPIAFLGGGPAAYNWCRRWYVSTEVAAVLGWKYTLPSSGSVIALQRAEI